MKLAKIKRLKLLTIDDLMHC